MKLTAKLAYSQLIINRRRTLWTLIGILMSTAMITATYSFAASGDAMFIELLGGHYYDDHRFTTTLNSLAAILSLIVIAVSIVVVSNAFRVSAGERTMQFGILKSVGATKRQIRETVVYEGVLLSIVGIPLGIILGFIVKFIGIQIANHFLLILGTLNEVDFVLPFVVSWQVILISIFVSFVTVILSAWLPASKAAKIPAINAIRGLGEIKIRAKKLRSSWLVQKLFGFEGTLASKSLKRNRRNFRATVISIAISIMLFIAASSISMQISRAADMVWGDIDAAVIAMYRSPITLGVDDDGVSYRTSIPISHDIANAVTEQLRDFPDTTVFGVGSNHNSYIVYVPREMLTSNMLRFFEDIWGYQYQYSIQVTLITVDPEHYAELCRRAGVPYGSNILINHFRDIDRNKGRWYELVPYIFDYQTLLIRDAWGRDTSFELPLHGELRVANIPNEVLEVVLSFSVNIIVPELDADGYLWFSNSVDIDGFVEHVNSTLDTLVPLDDGTEVQIGVLDLRVQTETIHNIGRMVMVFVYGFAAMLIIIGLTNVISTISTNVRSRAREFAVLKSVGMDDCGLSRMLNFESIFCSIRALIIGLPLGILVSLLIHRAIMDTAHFPYEFPWMAVLQCIFGVFVITWGITRYSAARLRGRNIIETIRSGSGV